MRSILLGTFAALAMTNSSHAQTDLASRLRQHVRAIASVEHNTSQPQALEAAARYIERMVTGLGYEVKRQEYAYAGHRVRNLEISLSSVAASQKPSRLYVVGAHYDSAPGTPGANDNGSGAAALLELARLLKAWRPPSGTEIRFVWFVNEEPPYFMGEGMGSVRHARALHSSGQKVEAAIVLETIGHYSNAKNSQRYPAGLENRFPSTGNFIAFVGITESAQLVNRALAAFRAASDFPAEGLAAPASTPGVTLSDHSSYNRFGFPALMVTDTAFMRYPHYHTAQDTPDKLDYPSLARVVDGLAKTIESITRPKP